MDDGDDGAKQREEDRPDKIHDTHDSLSWHRKDIEMMARQPGPEEYSVPKEEHR
jgi:hypothetical protein